MVLNTDIKNWPLDLLVDYVLKIYHRNALEMMPIIQKLLDSVGNTHPEIDEVKELFAASVYDLDVHFQKEENVLYWNIGKVICLNLLKSKVTLEKEKEFSIIGMIQVDLNKRVDYEIDQFRKDARQEINDVGIKYSEGRNDIINTFKKYDNDVSLLLKNAKSSLDKYNIDGDKIISSIQSKKSSINSLMLAVETQLKLAEGILKDTSQLGMARAFKERHSALKFPMWFWIISFFSCLGHFDKCKCNVR